MMKVALILSKTIFANSPNSNGKMILAIMLIIIKLMIELANISLKCPDLPDFIPTVIFYLTAKKNCIYPVIFNKK